MYSEYLLWTVKGLSLEHGRRGGKTGVVKMTAEEAAGVEAIAVNTVICTYVLYFYLSGQSLLLMLCKAAVLQDGNHYNCLTSAS